MTTALCAPQTPRYAERMTSLGPMKWFGPTWNSPMNGRCEEVATPVGEACLMCEQQFVAGDQGVVTPYVHGWPALPQMEMRGQHIDCHLRNLGIDPSITRPKPTKREEHVMEQSKAAVEGMPCERVVCRRCLAALDEVVGVTVSDGVISGLCPSCGSGIYARERVEAPKAQE